LPCPSAVIWCCNPWNWRKAAQHHYYKSSKYEAGRSARAEYLFVTSGGR
jgi:hypothetical protein